MRFSYIEMKLVQFLSIDACAVHVAPYEKTSGIFVATL